MPTSYYYQLHVSAMWRWPSTGTSSTSGTVPFIKAWYIPIHTRRLVHPIHNKGTSWIDTD